ncbi:mutator type transposase [Tanacetum coccineum]
MGNPVNIRPEGESFDIDVYGDFPKSLFQYTYNNLFSIKMHYAGRLNDSPNKQYVDGEICFVDMVDIADFKIDLLNTFMSCIGYEDDDELLLHYKIPLKSLDIGLKPLVSNSDISNNFVGYANNHKIMDVYVELVEKTESSSDEDGQSDSEFKDANDFVDEEHLVDEVEEDEPEKARSMGLRKLRKKHMSSGIRNKFYIGKEFANRDLAKDRIRAYAVETRRNLDFKVNDIRRIRVICNGVVPTLNSKNEYVDKLQGPKHDISKKGKGVMQDEKEDKICCPWLLYLNLITMNPQIPIKAIQEQMQKKYHVSVSKHKAFRAKAHVHLRGDVKENLCLLGYSEKGFQRKWKGIAGFGCPFIRGQYPGQMFTAMGMDANNGIYPVAYGIVKSKNQYSWTWFLTCLADDFDLFSNSNFTFITDRQKGLVPTIAKLFPSAEHRFCVRHINENMNLTWKGGDYKEMLWRQLLDAKDSPIITSLEYVREYLMKRIVIVQKVIQKSDVPLTPAVTKLFNKIKEAASECIVDWNGSDLFQVKDNAMDVGTPEDWVHESYKLQTWMNVYAHKINPVNDRDMWSKFECPTTLLPSKIAPQIGRPPKKRKKSKGIGHNKRGCKAIGSTDGVQIQLVARKHVATKPVARKPVQNKSAANKRAASEINQPATGTSQVATQGLQAATQASRVPTSQMKRTNMSACRLTPDS